MSLDRIIIDVREEDEFISEHIEGSINIPLTKLEQNGRGLFQLIHHKPISIMCRSGNRASLAYKTIQNLNFINENDDVEIFVGGIMEWKNQGQPVITQKLNHLPLLRQVHLIAGTMAFTFALLGYFYNSYFTIGAAFIGAGLAYAGATGTCFLAMILSKMPWNTKNKNIKQEVCTAGTGTIHCSK